jgi:putative exosortase-associated protein (TIGR04073 family)
MRNALTLLALIALPALLGSGCAGPEEKLGRGMSNTFEIVRLGEMRRSMEQAQIFDPEGPSWTTGLVTGLNRSLARTGVGIYEVVTFPIPSYDPLFTNYLSPNPAYPASYTPGLMADPNLATDTYTGFSGGDVAPFIPGSRFNVYDY